MASCRCMAKQIVSPWSACLMVLILTVSNAKAADELLADAVKRKDRQAIARLLETDGDLQATRGDGMSALHWAAFYDDTALCDRLLRAGANPNAANRYGVRPLSLACENGNGALVARLIQAGADPNTTLDGGETALMTAARSGDRDCVAALIAQGAALDAKDRRDQTAMMWAAAEGNLAAVDALLNAGADFETPLDSGFTPFFFAVRNGHGEVAFRMIEAGVDLREPMRIRNPARKGPDRGTTALHLAVENGHFELAARLLTAGADPNDDSPGYTVLHALTWVRKPIRGDGDPPPQGSGKVSSSELVEVLLEHGADVNARHRRGNSNGGRLNYKGATPVLMAAETGDLELVKRLVQAGADPLLPNEDHCTPFLAACGVGVLSNGDESAGTEREAIATAAYLLERGADINAVDDLGKSAMHGAAFKSWNEMVAFLMDHGADVRVWNQKNRRGWTPLMIAQGHRPGNFRPSRETVVAIEQAMERAGVK